MVVGVTGVEPVTFGLANRRSKAFQGSTELHPRSLSCIAATTHDGRPVSP
jgi:hypothetical protein